MDVDYSAEHSLAIVAETPNRIVSDVASEGETVTFSDIDPQTDQRISGQWQCNGGDPISGTIFPPTVPAPLANKMPHVVQFSEGQRTLEYRFHVVNLVPAVRIDAATNNHNSGIVQLEAVQLGEVATLSGTIVDDGLGPWTITVDFGDGNGPLEPMMFPTKEFSIPASPFFVAGIYEGSVTVEDTSSATSTQLFRIPVVEGPPEIQLPGKWRLSFRPCSTHKTKTASQSWWNLPMLRPRAPG